MFGVLAQVEGRFFEHVDAPIWVIMRLSRVVVLSIIPKRRMNAQISSSINQGVRFAVHASRLSQNRQEIIETTCSSSHQNWHGGDVGAGAQSSNVAMNVLHEPKALNQ
jgi:hypothetical protein